MRSSLFILLVSLSFSPSSRASSSNIPPSPLTGYRMSYESNIGRQCMSKQVSGGEADAILNRYGAHIEGAASEAFEKGTATALKRIADLGRADLVQGITFKLFPDGRTNTSGEHSCASFTQGKVLNIVAGNGSCGRNIDSTQVGMHILHEMGHSVGLALGLYGSYMNHSCHVSGYCTHNTSQPGSESFAESFAMFVHSPSTLQSKCPDTYDFIKNNVFNGKDSTAGVCQGIDTAIAGAPQVPSSGGTGGSTGGGGDMSGLLQLAANMAQVLNAQQKQEPAPAEQPAITVIPKRAPAAQCNRNSGQCGNAVRN